MSAPGLTETADKLKKLEAEFYDDIVFQARKAGIPVERIGQYAQAMQRYNSDLKKRKPRSAEGGLAKRVLGTFALISGFLAFYFLTPNITGAVIGDFSKYNTNLISLICLSISSVLLGLYLDAD
jgi:hypothetical protein